MKSDLKNPNANKRTDMKAGLIAGFIASAISLLFLAFTTWMALIPEFNYVLIQGSIFGFTKTIFSGWVISYRHCFLGQLLCWAGSIFTFSQLRHERYNFWFDSLVDCDDCANADCRSRNLSRTIRLPRCNSYPNI